jgi:hypothetical protein
MNDCNPRRRTGRSPGHGAGPIAEAPGETWNAVGPALKRGMPGGVLFGPSIGVPATPELGDASVVCASGNLEHQSAVPGRSRHRTSPTWRGVAASVAVNPSYYGWPNQTWFHESLDPPVDATAARSLANGCFGVTGWTPQRVPTISARHRRPEGHEGRGDPQPAVESLICS